MNNTIQFNTPVLLAIFNRPNTTRLVFEIIKTIKPKQLFVIADGPRSESEKIKCEQARAIIEQIDWDCEVKKNYVDQNLGCKRRMASGISWFFEQVEQGIILEDDCVPDQAFFWFCQELLQRYQNDQEVMHISGTNLQQGKNKTAASYYFSKKYFHVWGWATWRRAWQRYDLQMTDWSAFKNSEKFIQLFNKGAERKELIINIEKTFQGKIDTWDYQWVFACLNHQGLGIIPNYNLVSNIGFNLEATHTTNEKNIFNSLAIEKLDFPITHPQGKVLNPVADDCTFQLNKRNRFLNLFKRIINKLKS